MKSTMKKNGFAFLESFYWGKGGKRGSEEVNQSLEKCRISLRKLKREEVWGLFYEFVRELVSSAEEKGSAMGEMMSETGENFQDGKGIFNDRRELFPGDRNVLQLFFEFLLPLNQENVFSHREQSAYWEELFGKIRFIAALQGESGNGKGQYCSPLDSLRGFQKMMSGHLLRYQQREWLNAREGDAREENRFALYRIELEQCRYELWDSEYQVLEREYDRLYHKITSDAERERESFQIPGNSWEIRSLFQEMMGEVSAGKSASAEGVTWKKILTWKQKVNFASGYEKAAEVSSGHGMAARKRSVSREGRS